jgi:hypothetical protein
VIFEKCEGVHSDKVGGNIALQIVWLSESNSGAHSCREYAASDMFRLNTGRWAISEERDHGEAGQSVEAEVNVTLPE